MQEGKHFVKMILTKTRKIYSYKGNKIVLGIHVF